MPTNTLTNISFLFTMLVPGKFKCYFHPHNKTEDFAGALISFLVITRANVRNSSPPQRSRRAEKKSSNIIVIIYSWKKRT